MLRADAKLKLILKLCCFIKLFNLLYINLSKSLVLRLDYVNIYIVSIMKRTYRRIGAKGFFLPL